MTNIALVVLDTMRKDVFDYHFDWLPGYRFENAWSPSSWTVPVHGSIFGGKYPSELGVHAKAEKLDTKSPVLAELLQRNGYQTRAFSSNPFISQHFDFHRGFEDFKGSWRLRRLAEDIFDWNYFISETSDQGPSRFIKALWQVLRSDADTKKSINYGIRMKLHDLGFKSLSGTVDDGAKAALDMIRKTNFSNKDFLFVNLMEAHSPYDPPKDYKTNRIKDNPGLEDIINSTQIDPDPYLQAYNNCVRYLSDMYQKIFNELKKDFDYIITLGDHGEMFGEHNMWGHVHGLFPELTHVPLILYDGREKHEKSSEMVNLIDVHRTVLEISGIEAESKGQDLRDPVSKKCLMEFHGLNNRQIKRLKINNYSEDIIEKYDTFLNGIAIPPSYYQYQTLDTVIKEGESNVDDPDACLDEMKDQLEVRKDPPTSNNRIPEHVESQLADLGYY